MTTADLIRDHVETARGANHMILLAKIRPNGIAGTINRGNADRQFWIDLRRYEMAQARAIKKS